MPDRILVLAGTASTNLDVRRLAETCWPEGRWLRAERQTAGKGRLGRAWLGEPGNLFASTLIELRPTDPAATDIALLAGVAAYDALVDLLPDVPFRLKWPNDVMVGRAKLAGMLLERVPRGVVLGVGINVAHAPALPDRETVALADLAEGDEVSVAGLAEALADHFAHWLARWRAAGTAIVIEAWLERGHRHGEALEARLPDGETVRGAFAGLDPIGALIVGLDDGARRVIHAGDVGLL